MFAHLFGRDIISKLHYQSEAHLTVANLVSIFNQKIYSPNVDKIAKQTTGVYILPDL